MYENVQAYIPIRLAVLELFIVVYFRIIGKLLGGGPCSAVPEISYTAECKGLEFVAPPGLYIAIEQADWKRYDIHVKSTKYLRDPLTDLPPSDKS